MSNEYPFIASIGLKARNFLEKRYHFCGGSLITRTHVLTAAHCVENRRYSEMDVVIGEINLRNALYTYEVDNWITYNDWAQSRNISIVLSYNDIAILTVYIYNHVIELTKKKNITKQRGIK